ncbi:MAG: helix-turn-helix transcriptional regulator [Acidobacteriota bacterium]
MPATPLKLEVFHILVALAEKERHGYSLIQAVREHSDGAIRLRTGPLYRRLRQLLDSGLVEESPDRPPSEHDDRRRRCYYRLSELGHRVVRRECLRLARLVSKTRRLGLIESLDP